MSSQVEIYTFFLISIIDFLLFYLLASWSAKYFFFFFWFYPAVTCKFPLKQLFLMHLYNTSMISYNENELLICDLIFVSFMFATLFLVSG